MNTNEIPRPSDGEPKLTTLAQWRASIIDRIYRDGLMSGKMLREGGKNFLGSADSELNWEICGVSIWPDDPPYFWDNAIYQHAGSILPTITERPSEHALYQLPDPKPQAQRLIEQRAHSSFLVVCRENQIENYVHIPSHIFFYLIFPRAIWEEYCRTTTNQPKEKPPIKIVNNTVEIVINSQVVSIPNYERALREIVAEDLRTIIFVHGVRLPTTKSDIVRLTPAHQ